MTFNPDPKLQAQAMINKFGRPLLNCTMQFVDSIGSDEAEDKTHKHAKECALIAAKMCLRFHLMEEALMLCT